MAYLALDLGAGSGRAIVGTIVDGRICLDEIHRFENKPVQLGNTLHWNFLSLFENIKQGIFLAVKKGYNLKGIAVDTWGVDFGLIDKAGHLVSNPVTYRDHRTLGMAKEATQNISKEYLYESTGIQQMEINTIFQLYSLHSKGDPSLCSADKLLFTPDLINYFLTGVAANEYTIASTSQLLNAKTRQWDEYIFRQLELPFSVMEEIIKPGEIIGSLSKTIVEETGAIHTKVFAVGSHDTASAIGAIPAEGGNWAFLSSGTWSLLGLLTDEPILTSEAMLNDFTNEGGVNGKILFMRNITGLWLLQQLIAEWEKKDEKKYSYEYLLSEAIQAKAFQSIVNPDDVKFSNPSSMSAAIESYCASTNQVRPVSKGEFVRCVMESLALKYYFVVKKLKECSGRKIEQLYVVGGGSQNDLLNQYTADALNVIVSTGMTESTAIGNIMQQAIADETVKDWNEGHEIIKNSFILKSYYPKDNQKWLEISENVKHLF
ncbi:rhamnulokinase [Dysgonomonas alginatilytica]|uniref:Rhamnulokinase n=1 Tax=Dysgonomonas alginatilytica TaxID=1605892 RepID=A0A2V3PR11_9BACT|nr:rhamnulokinase family protein [Dysgonomonas alginatilytica]PXV64724.1 rhamnulokinase [Dysgonomonas alginatilytica]